MNKQITASLKAWIPSDYYSLRDIKQSAEIGEPARGLQQLAFTVDSQDMATQGWTHVGSARVTFDPLDDEAATLSQIATLKKELEGVRVAAETHVRRIEDKIQNLMAITYQPEAE